MRKWANRLIIPFCRCLLLRFCVGRRCSILRFSLMALVYINCSSLDRMFISQAFIQFLLFMVVKQIRVLKSTNYLRAKFAMGSVEGRSLSGKGSGGMADKYLQG